jgi:hypothetical protein
VFTARYGLIPCIKLITFRLVKVKVGKSNLYEDEEHDNYIEDYATYCNAYAWILFKFRTLHSGMK